MVEKLKKGNGITLISLIITIVIMLILAAVAISLVIGKNGLFTKAKASVDISEKRAAEEKVNLILGEYSMDQVDSSRELDSFLNEKVDDNEIESFNNNNDGTYTIKEDKYNVVVKTEDLSIVSSEKINEVKVSRVGIKVGDYIKYEPDDKTDSPYTNLTETCTGSTSNDSSIAQEKLNWQILKINDDGSMDIIGSPTSKSIYFSNVTGYNNGVKMMNDVCKTLYSRASNGITARSVNINDIEYWLKNPSKVRDGFATYNGGPTYGHTETYMTNRYYPNLYAKEVGSKIDSGLSGLSEGIDKEIGNKTGLSISDNGNESGRTEASKSITATQNYYSVDINDENYGDGAKALYNENNYWVASRCISCNPTYVYFGLRISGPKFSSYDMFDSNTTVGNKGTKLRPVVHLSTNVKIETSETASNLATPHLIIGY